MSRVDEKWEPARVACRSIRLRAHIDYATWPTAFTTSGTVGVKVLDLSTERSPT